MNILAGVFLAGAVAAAEPAATEEPAPAPRAATEVLVPAASAGEDGRPRTVRVTSDRASYMRKDGVIAFDGHVAVDDVEFKMHADEVFLFLQGTNELKRVVALGNVAVTNGLRSGSCAKATYNRELSKVVLHGDQEKGIVAHLEDNGRHKSSVDGRKITFWIDTEQVEVEQSTVTVDAGGVGAKEGVKGIIGK